MPVMATFGKIGEGFGLQAAQYPRPPITKTFAVAEADAMTTDAIMLGIVVYARLFID